jgi:hypothetical protein
MQLLVPMHGRRLDREDDQRRLDGGDDQRRLDGEDDQRRLDGEGAAAAGASGE